MGEIGPAEPPVSSGATPWSASRMTSTLAAYYQRKRRHLGEVFPGFYDPGLQRLFSPRPETDSPQTAGELLRRWRRHIVNATARWTGQRKFDIDRLVGKLIRRCDALDLYVTASEIETVSEASSFVTAVMNNVVRFAEGP